MQLNDDEEIPQIRKEEEGDEARLGYLTYICTTPSRSRIIIASVPFRENVHGSWAGAGENEQGPSENEKGGTRQTDSELPEHVGTRQTESEPPNRNVPDLGFGREVWSGDIFMVF